MLDFVSYTPINRSSKPITTRTLNISGPLDDYLATYQTTSKTTSEAPQKAFSFKWASGGVKEIPYSVSGPTSEIQTSSDTSSYKNLSLAEALRTSADYAKNKAGSKSTHNCAKYVSNALEAAGIHGFDRLHGWNYDRVTALLGMHEVTGEATYKKGDIAVTKTKDGTGHAAICNRDGATLNDSDAWSSDFNSKAHPYSLNRIDYAKVFRAQKGLKLIKRHKI